jgi:hypothetical protein
MDLLLRWRGFGAKKTHKLTPQLSPGPLRLGVDLGVKEIDIAVWAIAHAGPAAYAMVFDVHFPMRIPADGIDGTLDHAQGVLTVSATGGHQIMVDLDPLSDQA